MCVVQLSLRDTGLARHGADQVGTERRFRAINGDFPEEASKRTDVVLMGRAGAARPLHEPQENQESLHLRTAEGRMVGTHSSAGREYVYRDTLFERIGLSLGRAGQR